MRLPLRVLVLCTGNSARSQMAEALLSVRGAGRVVAESAGSRPAGRVNPWAIRALAEVGIEWTGRAPRGLPAIEDQPWDVVLTVCDHAREACPVFPAGTIMAHWGQPDPAEAAGDEAAKLAAFREARDLLARRVDQFLALDLEGEDETGLRGALRRIGRTPGAPPGGV